MAVHKPISGNDTVNGLATVMTGSGRAKLYDNTQRTQHIPDPAGTAYAQNLDDRYRFHGGPGGSGNWEH